MTETVTYWAELWRPMATNVHGESLISPSFDTQAELAAWVRARRENFESVGTHMRKARDGDYEDIPLHTEEAPLPDPERLHRLVGDLKAMLETKKRELDGKRPAGKPYSSVGTFNPIERPQTYHEAYPDDPTP